MEKDKIMDEITVSVYFSTYNQEKYVRQALDSIMMQKTSFAYEVIAADDFSTDGTRDVILEYQKQYPQIRTFFTPENIGGSKKLVQCIEGGLFRGKYIAILEGDDYWINENRLQILVDFLEQHPEYSRVSHRREIVDENGTRRGYDLPESRLNRAFTIDDYMQGWVYGDFCSLFRNYYREAGNRFNSLFLASRNVCDFQDMFITQEFGPVYILGDCLAAYRSRSTQGETNYNSITSQIERCRDHIHIAETLEAFFRGKYDLSPYKTFNRTRIVNERITAGDAANYKADLAAIAAPERIRILTEQLYLRLRAKNKAEARFILKNNAFGDNVRVFLSLPLYLVKRVIGRARKTNGPQALKGYVRA